MKGNDINYYAAYVISVIMILILAALVVLILYAMFSVRRLFSAIKNFCMWFLTVLRDFIYPEEMDDEHIAGLYSEEAEKERVSALLAESKELEKNFSLADYIKNHEIVLSTFRDLECPKCKKALYDGDKVIVIECESEHTYHSKCMDEILKNNL